ncbi:hypothetical protein ACMFMF_004934 [Clarireedia jacksonii]
MRLLHCDNDGNFSLTEFFESDIPQWGAEEVTFKDMIDGTGKSKAGYGKIQFCGEQAKRNSLQYFWVDTCCIDKSNNVELAEAINLMFRWYRDATKCYVYLPDVSRPCPDSADGNGSNEPWESTFRKSEWFTRGWTLQELIAPASVDFFSKEGELLGNKASLEQHICEITGIPINALRGSPLSHFSITERMSWAASRETYRQEDKVYSLLGIFDVKMPLLYSEGADNAFNRLKEELLKRAKKHWLDEIPTGFSNSAKRLKTSHSQSSVPSYNDPKSFNPEWRFSEYTVHTIDTATKQSIIHQLYFPKIDERLTNLTAAQGKTCRWFLNKPEYVLWYNIAQQPDYSGFLWIKGHPGTGKSTLMKLLFEEAKSNVKSNPSKIILSFFFLARGIIEERSTTGLYRSLLHQLFEKAVELRDSLEWMTADGVRVIERNGWNEEALKQTLIHTVSKLGNRSLMIFVDALDECNQDQARGMVCFFEDLVEQAQNDQVQLQICFSSRHYPTVTIQKGVEIILEDEIGHKEDIEKYIRSRLRLGKSEQAELLRSEILEKSSSIFLWVVLVLEILNSEYPNSSVSVKKIRERLKEIPPKLADLFELILARDGDNIEQLQICLKLILFANRPLQPQELYFAIQLGINQGCSGYWDQEDVDLHQIETFVRSSSKGLAEVTRNKVSEVQFIHESVRDFLLSKFECQWSGLSGEFAGHGHEILRNCCLAQVNTQISQQIDIPDPLPQLFEAAATLRKAVRLKFPFLEYSVLNVLYHADSAQQNAIEQGDFLAKFPLQQWIFFNNILEEFDYRRYTKSASIFYILAEKNLADLIRIHPHREPCFEFKDERYGPPIFAAVVAGSYKAVKALMEKEAITKPLTSPLHDLCKQYPSKKNKKLSIRYNFTFSRQRTVLSYLAEHGDEILFLFLLNLDKHIIDTKDKNGRTPLSWAAGNGHDAVVKLLLEKGADIESKDSKYSQTPLLWAAKNGHDAVVKLLLEKGADIESKDSKYGQTPLLWAAKNGHDAVVKLLLEKGADTESKDSSEYGQTPLLWAAKNRHNAVVKLLLEKGADTESKDSSEYGQTLLSWAARIGYDEIVKLLLEKDVDIESKDSEYSQTPLLWAAENGHDAVVKLLLEKGADIESKDKNSRTPLLWAAENGHDAVVKLLLEKGADIESKDKNSRTPLSWAAENTFDAVPVVKLLLEKGADIESKDRNDRTPLSWAAENRRDEIVRLLLEKGADIESKDKISQTPLLWATMNGRDKIVELLLEKGANIESKDSEGGQTPLLWAIRNGRNKIVKLLLEKGADIESKDSSEYGQTPLLWAARFGYNTAAKLLLEKGADIESKDKNSRTPLLYDDDDDDDDDII